MDRARFFLDQQVFPGRMPKTGSCHPLDEKGMHGEAGLILCDHTVQLGLLYGSSLILPIPTKVSLDRKHLPNRIVAGRIQYRPQNLIRGLYGISPLPKYLERRWRPSTEHYNPLCVCLTREVIEWTT